jgi:hypothetical protein
LMLKVVVKRDFYRFEAVINYDEAHKRFFSFYLRFGEARGCYARGHYLYTRVPAGMMKGGARRPPAGRGWLQCCPPFVPLHF